jgi:hypothetical protein
VEFSANCGKSIAAAIKIDADLPVKFYAFWLKILMTFREFREAVKFR